MPASRAKFILPASIQIEDVIKVTFKESDGIIVEKTARVARREYIGQERVYYTHGGGEIFRWCPGHRAPRITLLSAAPGYYQETLAGL